MPSHSASCHCGAVSIEFTAPKSVQLTKCNCSMCQRTGHEHIFVLHKDATIKGESNLTLYTFGTGAAKHYFCKACGTKPFYIPRSHPESYSVNLRCLDRPSLTISEVIEFDGENWEDNVESLRDATE